MRKPVFILALLLALCLGAACAAETAPTEYISGRWTYILLEDGTAEVVGFGDPRTSFLNIPDELDGHTVTGVNAALFSKRQRTLTSIQIGAGVRDLSSLTAKAAPKLELILVSPDNPHFAAVDGMLLSKSGDVLIRYPMYSSTGSCVIPDSVTTIGEGAFSGCNNLTGITIPDSVTAIAEDAFHDCDDLAAFTVSPDNDVYASIDGVLFRKADRTLLVFPMAYPAKAYSIPDGIQAIAPDAFYDCNGLTSVIIPGSVTAISFRAFQDCSALTSITIPDSVTAIDNGAFWGCSALGSITIPDSVTAIDNGAFWGCSSLTSIVIPDSVTSIGSSAFRDCSSLTSITIPDSVTTLGESAFWGCSALGSIAIPNGLTIIDAYTFMGCSSLSSIIIPDGVTLLNGPFSGCSSLSSITIPGSVTVISGNAFAQCSPDLILTVDRNSYARQYAIDNGIPFTYPDALDWLHN